MRDSVSCRRFYMQKNADRLQEAQKGLSNEGMVDLVDVIETIIWIRPLRGDMPLKIPKVVG